MSSIKILSATYCPADESDVTRTRDVTGFVRVLLLARQQHEQEKGQSETDDFEGDDMYRIATSGLFIPLMDRRSRGMNAIFGDPCPGTSKRLNVHYVVRTADAVEMHRATFAEHERVILRRRVTFYQDESKLKNAVVACTNKHCDRVPSSGYDVSGQDENASMLRSAVRMGRAQSIDEFAQATTATDRSSEINLERAWRLRSATSEIVLPIIMQFLDIRERVRCQLVCKVWRIVVRQWGVAQTVDVNDGSFPNFNRTFLRGILSHSYSSLHSLYLNDFVQLTKQDLHPAIPHLRKLRSLDISRCNQLDDSTLQLISEHLNCLEVFYMKSLQKVTDEGFIAICRGCTKLQVLEISYVMITDTSGIAIGENLTQLRALYMRDNYLLTKQSIDAITENCTHLSQLTLWGCIRLSNLSFEGLNLRIGCGNLVLLNLWGCHSLLDAAANALKPMRNLRSLIVSECHRLTDAFLVDLAQYVPNLAHLHLRYCKRVTDTGINAITESMHNIYSLDLSFCTRISVASIFNLLEIRCGTLSELRLRNCNQLSITTNAQSQTSEGSAGRSILAAIQTNDHCLCTLDVRNCGSTAGLKDTFRQDDPFVQGMTALLFDQTVPGFFSRPARWNSNVQTRLLRSLEEC